MLCAVLYFNCRSSTLVGVIVPEQEDLISWAKDNGKASLNFEQLCGDKEVNRMIFENVIAAGKAAKLHSFEQVKKVYVDSQLFSVENNMV
jgi:long-chain acyl-CoA synthetase